jgi:predicted mannosyl-3-phosphoglycerate phosphatase (HAD superfamily)
LRQTSSILYIAVDSLIPDHGKSVVGLDEFTAALDHAGIPAVWLTHRSRLQFDEPRRKHAHTHPFIAEGGSCVYMPEDYFHLRVEKTVRLGRFTCIPVAQPLPAASEALESLSQETGVTVVPLQALSPRELAQNTGLPQRDAELARQRDFDEVFFFAGASDNDIQKFLAEAARRHLQLRQHGVLWSLAVGASVQRCVRDLSKLYDRALRSHAAIVGVATEEDADNLFPYCDRNFLLTRHLRQNAQESWDQTAHGGRITQLALGDPKTWAVLLHSLGAKSSMEGKEN